MIVARHAYPDEAEKIACAWSQERGGLGTEKQVYGKSELVPDVVNAWIKGEALTKLYAPTEEFAEFPPLTVNADFTARGEGVFVTYLIGHVHRDVMAKSAVYPEQNVLAFAASANDDWQNYGCDLPRERDTKAEDCITVLTVDPEKRRIHLVRVGSNITLDLVERTHTTITY